MLGLPAPACFLRSPNVSALGSKGPLRCTYSSIAAEMRTAGSSKVTWAGSRFVRDTKRTASRDQAHDAEISQAKRDLTREFLQRIAPKLGIKEPEDWYAISTQQVCEFEGGNSLLREFGTLAHALRQVFPEVKWQVFRFPHVPRSYWKDPAHQREFLDYVAQQLRVSSPEDWYRVRFREVIKLGGTWLIREHGCFSTALRKLYPELTLHPWRFDKVPRGYWNDRTNHRQFFDWVGERLGVRQMDDWYNVRAGDFAEAAGVKLVLSRYDFSVPAALRKIYPEHQWLEWKFKPVLRGFWNDLKNQRKFFDWLGEKLEVKTPMDWYKVKIADVIEHGGRSVLDKYGKSLVAALQHIYPEQNWTTRNFEGLPQGFWDDIRNQREFFDDLRKQLKLQSPEDWYSVSTQLIMDLGGSAVLTRYGGDLGLALSAAYPEHIWHVWKFGRTPNGFWRNKQNQRDFLDWVAIQMNIKTPDGWYSVKNSDLLERKGGGILAKFNNSMAAMLQSVYPEVEWQVWRFGKVPKQFWEDEKNIASFVKWASEQLSISQASDWKNVSSELIASLGGRTLFRGVKVHELLERKAAE